MLHRLLLCRRLCGPRGTPQTPRRACNSSKLACVSTPPSVCASTATSVSLRSAFTAPAPAAEATASAAPSARLPPAHVRPPPLSMLSWAVDGSGHTHHRCRRRLSAAERIPLVCETIRMAAPDLVALQDSTAELAAALTSADGGVAEAGTPGLHVHCAELAHELLRQGGHTGEVAGPVAAEEGAGRKEPPQLADAVPVAEAALPRAPACRYRLVGRARNGRCGEVQLFIRDDSVWEAALLPGMGAGLTAELRSRAVTAAAADATTPSAPSPPTEGGSASARTAVPGLHRCVVTTVDLSYRGKSLGTSSSGLLTSAAVSADGSPFTLETQQPSASAGQAEGALTGSSSRRRGRAPDELDGHRAVALDWVHHHVRPDVLLGNLFLGAREHVRGFEDAWVRAGSPVGQERTTNTCARHRVDHRTNYFYFRPSPHAAPASASLARPQQERSGDEAPGVRDAVVVPADAPVGTAVPLDAARDEASGAWRVPTAPAAAIAEAPAERGGASGGAGEAAGVARRDDATQPVDGALGMPEVAGRFQRCLLRAWVRRGPGSRSGHHPTQPLLRQYRRCRVVVLRPMTEVPLSDAEQAWHTRYLAAQYGGRRVRAATASSGAPTARLDEDATPVSEESEGDAAAEHGAAAEVPRVAAVKSRVRCSASDQYPLLTLLS